MKSLRFLSGVTLVLLFALAFSACQKNAQTEVSQATDSTQVSQGYGNETTPPATTETGTPSTMKPGEKSTSKSRASSRGTKSGSSKGTSAMNAESHSIEIPAGSTFDVTMVTPVDTRTSAKGDHVEASLAAPLTIDGKVVADQGAKVSGEVSDLQKASRHKGEDDRAFIALDFNTIETVDGPKALHATVNNAEGKMVAKGTSTRDKLLVAGGAVAGAITGKVAGGSTKSTIIGAVAGAAAGTGAMLMVKGHELQIEQGAKVSLRVDKPILVVER